MSSGHAPIVELGQAGGDGRDWAGLYRMISCLANGLALPLEPGCARFPEDV
jgi:hypothetical protein